MKNHQFAGITVIATSLGFVAVFGYLAGTFGYPDVLDSEAAAVLPALSAGGPKLRWTWALYAALPSGVALTAILAHPLFRRSSESAARLGVVSAVLSAVAMTAGLARWPTIHHALAQRFAHAGNEERALLSTLFDASNLYLGNVTGEFIGEVTLSIWFATSSLALLRGAISWRWPGHLGLFTAASMIIGSFRNVTPLVDPVSALNDNLLPVWLVVLGVALLFAKAKEAPYCHPMAVGS
jgi:hypothetical protein